MYYWYYYRREAVRQGSCSVGIRSKRFAVVGAIKRSHNDLASHQEKVFKIDDHIGIAVSGLTADARTLATYMRSECLYHKYSCSAPIVSGRLVRQVADKHQKKTMESWNRPYGVGLLVVSHDVGYYILLLFMHNLYMYIYSEMALIFMKQIHLVFIQNMLQMLLVQDHNLHEHI